MPQGVSCQWRLKRVLKWRRSGTLWGEPIGGAFPSYQEALFRAAPSGSKGAQSLRAAKRTLDGAGTVLR